MYCDVSYFAAYRPNRLDYFAYVHLVSFLFLRNCFVLIFVSSVEVSHRFRCDRESLVKVNKLKLFLKLKVFWLNPCEEKLYFFLTQTKKNLKSDGNVLMHEKAMKRFLSNYTAQSNEIEFWLSSCTYQFPSFILCQLIMVHFNSFICWLFFFFSPLSLDDVCFFILGWDSVWPRNSVAEHRSR